MNILKYPLRAFAGVGVYNLPEDWLLISVKVQDNTPVLYVEGDSTKPVESLTMYCLHTGDEVPDEVSIHIGTVILDEGKYVLHYFI